MRKCIFVLVCLSTIFSFSQETELKRKGQLYFKLGVDYRITPIYEGGTFNPTVSPDAQASGSAFNYNLYYFITKNFSIGFGQSFRYDYIATVVEGGDVSTSTSNDKGLMLDYHFYADYHLPIFNESELFLRFGKSLLNRGSFYSQKTVFRDESGAITGSVTNLRDTAYEPYNAAIGWKKNRIEFMGGIYFSANTDYDLTSESGSFIVPYLNVTYSLFKL